VQSDECLPMKMTTTTGSGGGTVEDEAFAKIKMGVNVDIKRSDGRIHSAVVSGINPETRSVTVEWFERGETKGKEIELEAILGLNQDLLPPLDENGQIVPNKLSKYVPRPAAGGGGNGNQGSNQGGGQGGMRTRNKQTTSSRQTQNGVSGFAAAAAASDKHSSGESENVPPATAPTRNAMPPPPAPSDTAKRGPGGAGGGSGGNGGGAAVDRRRSNVVKEVERLKKNREERRAKQQEMLEEKEKAVEMNANHANYDFFCMIQDYQEQLEFNPVSEDDAWASDHQITVCVRKRPINAKERKKKEIDVTCVPKKDHIIIHEPKTKVDLTKFLENQHFRFDFAFDENSSNDLVYKYTAKPLVVNIFEGGMATCFAYGQTGSGKTHTMGGEFHGKQQDSKGGIYALATKDVFKYLNSAKYKNLKLQVSCSYFEIYSGKVFDLLSGKSKLRVLEDGKQQVVVVGLQEKEVDCVEDVLKLINHGNSIRTSGQTSANAHSSRSHAVFQIILRNSDRKKSLHGKFSLIDLAGNERGADTSSANRQTRMEGAEINKSLLALKECIRALGRKGGHLPFRASKLTQVLRDSFIGEKSKTCMIAMVSPALGSCEHTLNTLRYADRVKELGAGDPTKADDDRRNNRGPEMRMDDGVISPEDSDLAQLRSMNEGELSADWYNFQEAITHLQEMEEDLVDTHHNVIQTMQNWVQDDSQLISMTQEVDYDQDAYCQQLEDMIDEKIEALKELRGKAKAFRANLIDEESKSRLLQQKK